MQKRGKEIKCYYCAQPIRFDSAVRADSGKAIPLNQDGMPHDCPESPFNKWKRARELPANGEKKTAIAG